MENIEYIKKFVVKHNYDSNIHIQCLYPYTVNDIVSVVFNEKDIPSKKTIKLTDIQYDIDSDLPCDVFDRWLEYCLDNQDVDYIDWFTKMPDVYVPNIFNEIDNNLDITESEIKESINNLFELFNNKYGFIDDSDSDFDFDDSDFDDSDFDFDE